MRYALRSGLLAARSISEGGDYTGLWRRELLPLLRAGVVNRFVFNMAGERVRRLALWKLSQRDAAAVLGRFYQPSLWSRLLFPVAALRYRAPLRDRSCDHANCDCVWCECQAETGSFLSLPLGCRSPGRPPVRSGLTEIKELTGIERHNDFLD